MTKQEEGKLQSKFTRWPPSWIWAFQVSGPPQLLCVSLTIVYTCQDHVLESLKMAFFVVVLDSKYSKMTPKFVKRKSHWLHSSIKFANPEHDCNFVLKRKFDCTTVKAFHLPAKRECPKHSWSETFYFCTLLWYFNDCGNYNYFGIN